MELWRDAPGHEGYQVSNEGRVKSLAREIVYKDGRIKHQKEKLLKPQTVVGGYLRICLSKDGKKEYPKVHRLVAQAFLPNPHGYTEVNHKDENKTNNTVWVNEDGSVDLEKSNLEWCTHEYNMNYGTRNQRSAEGRSKKVYQYTLDGTLVKIWKSTQECGRNGFGQGNVAACCRGELDKYKGFRWSYVPL